MQFNDRSNPPVKTLDDGIKYTGEAAGARGISLPEMEAVRDDLLKSGRHYSFLI
jgi:hypothetical protein